MFKDHDGFIHMTPAQARYKFNKMIEDEKILMNKLKPYLGTFELDEMVTMVVAYTDGGPAKVLEILDDDNTSVRSSLYSKRGSVLSSKRDSQIKFMN